MLAKCRAAKMLRPCTEIGLGHLPVEALYYVRSQCFIQPAIARPLAQHILLKRRPDFGHRGRRRERHIFP